MLLNPKIEAALKVRGITSWIAPGVLVPRRGFYATKKVVQALTTKWPAMGGRPQAEMDDLRQEMLDVVVLWQTGGCILAGDQLKPMKPYSDGVWTLRAAGLKPGTRTFGTIPERNIFVASSVVPRNILGDKGSGQWETSVGVAAGIASMMSSDATIVCHTKRGRFRQPLMGSVCDEF